MKTFGFTLNYLTLLGLSLSVGLLVDDAIVVLENIFRHVEHGEERRRAASTATAEIGLAVTATTFSLVAVFGPIATTGGIVGRMLRDFGLTVSAAVLISLFVSFTLTPMLSARFVTLPSSNAFTRGIETILTAVESVYLAIVRRALCHRALVVLGALGVFATSLWMMTLVDKEMVPGMDRSQFQIFIETPPGSSLERTQEVVNEVAAPLEGVEGVKFLVTTLGGGVQGKVENATIYVELVDRHERSFGQFDLMNALRRRYEGYAKATVSVEEIQMFSIGGMRAAILQFNVRGPSQLEAARLADRITERMREAGGYTDIDTTYRAGKPEFGLKPDRERAYSLGVPVALVGQTLRFAVAGDKVSDYKEAGEQHAIRVRLDEKVRGDLETLKGLEVRSPSGRTVELGNVATFEPGQGPLSIDRQAGQRQVTVMANLSGKALGPAIEEMRAFAVEEIKVPGYSTDFAGQAEFMDENFREITKALILAIILIYFILAAQFESFVHPFTIMLSLPLSIVGGVGALLVMRDTLSILGMIGFVMLMGLVTKNAILLVDFAILGRGRGLSANDAVVEAGRTRLRPILMTTAAMVFGMLPIAMALSKGSEARAPMAVVVIGGVIASTVLTLVVVPVVYSLFEGALHRFGASASSRE
jgi:HAE1 family hydrophobic/amphiphilic exporter-1